MQTPVFAPVLTSPINSPIARRSSPEGYLRLGQGGANDEFLLAPFAGIFLNSSFGYPAILALDLPSGGPNYPLAVPFFRFFYSPKDQISLMTGVYTDDPGPPGTGDPQLRDRHGTAFRFDDHALSRAELWCSPAFLAGQGVPGTYKLGAWFATGAFDPSQATDRLSLATPAITRSTGSSIRCCGTSPIPRRRALPTF